MTRIAVMPIRPGRRLLLMLCLIFLESTVQSQTAPAIPPSPNAATFQRFGDYPVDYSTGLANISLPIYEIKVKDFRYPVSLRFHASGRRPNDDYSPMGVGWMLDATGYISREVRERPDELYTGLDMSATQVQNINQDGMHRAYDLLIAADMNIPNGHTPTGASENQKLDAEHDIYSYSVNGLSGKFALDKFGFTVPLTYTPNTIGQSMITDEKGNQYQFTTGPYSVETVSVPGNSYIMTRFLTKIKLASGEEINFVYDSRPTSNAGDYITGRWSRSQIFEVGSINMLSSGGTFSEITDYYANKDGLRDRSTASYTDYTITYLKEINFPNGKVSFTYDNQTLRLTEIKATNNNSAVVKWAAFNYIQTPGTSSTYSTANNQAISLSTVQMKDNAGAVVETYSMDYYNDTFPGRSPEGYPYADWWGYSNIAGSKPPFKPSGGQNPVVNSAMTNTGCATCKDPNFNAKRSGMIKKISYPTGGATEFEYEPNYYTDVDGVKEGPGLRISKITSYESSTSQKLIKTYKYGQNEDGQGYVARIPNTDDFWVTRTYDVWDIVTGSPLELAMYYIWTFTPTPIESMREAYAQPLYYNQVTEYARSENGVNNGKRIYQYSLPQYLKNFSFPTAWRRKEYAGAKLIDDGIYAFRADRNDYQLIEETNYSYGPYRYAVLPQVKVWRTWFLRYDDGQSTRDNELYCMDDWNIPSPLNYRDWPIESAIEKLNTESHYSYQADGSFMTTTKNYYYDDTVHMQPTRVVTTTSTGDKLSVESKYIAGNYGGPGYIILPLETSTYRLDAAGTNKRLISSTLTSWDVSKIQPLKQYKMDLTAPITDFVPAVVQSGGTVVKDSRYKEKLSFNLYDANSNVLEMQKTNDMKESYLWDSIYPIARVVNASASDIAYTSFESNYKGNWTVTVTPETNTSAPTGTTVHNLSGSNMTKAINSGMTYIISYWRPVALPVLSIPGTQAGYPITGRTANGWTYYEHKITGVSTATLAGAGIIDEVRLYPFQAQMTTYTYRPLVGMTSQSDAAGKTTYYDYDTYNRLQAIRDLDRNIIKTVDYKYKTP